MNISLYFYSFIFFQIQFQITMKMRKSLSRLGFKEEDVRMLKPAEAARIIKHSVKKQTWENDVATAKRTER